MGVRVGLWRKLSTEELMLLNCGVGEDSWETLGLQGDPTSPSKGDQSWVFIGRTDAEAKTPVLGPPHVKSWLIGKDPDSGKDWGHEGKGMTEDEMVGWHHWLDGHEFGWTLGVGDGQGGLACCDSWGCKESDMTERLIWTELNLGGEYGIWSYLQCCPPTSVLWLLLYVFGYRISFLVGSSLFYFVQQLSFWCGLEREHKVSTILSSLH